MIVTTQPVNDTALPMPSVKSMTKNKTENSFKNIKKAISYRVSHKMFEEKVEPAGHIGISQWHQGRKRKRVR